MVRKPERCSQILGLIVLLIAVLSCSAQAQSKSVISQVEKEISQKMSALDSIKTELENGRARLKELQSEEGNYLSRLEQLEKNIAASETYLEMVQLQIDTVETTLGSLNDSLGRAEVELERARELMKRRLRNAYKTREISKLQMLLTSKSPVELIQRIRYFQELNRYDKRLAEKIETTISSIDQKKIIQEKKKEQLEVLLAEKQEEQQLLVEEENSKRSVLEDIRTKKDSYASMVKELEAAQEQLDGIIKLLEQRRKKAKELDRKAKVAFQKRKGKLSWPVKGKVISKFGKIVHPVYKTVIMNKGIDIAAKKGDPVECVAFGSVVHVGWMRGLGKLVIVDHQGGYITVYAHLDEIKVDMDQEVDVATVLGSVGETGSASGAKLHFEVRKATESLDPEEWLD